MTPQELRTIELEEYNDLVGRLTKNADFNAFIARWVMDAGTLPFAAISLAGLDQANYQIGRVSLLSEFMDSLKLVHHAAYLNIQGEVNDFSHRRDRTDDASRASDDGDGDGTEVYEDD